MKRLFLLFMFCPIVIGLSAQVICHKNLPVLSPTTLQQNDIWNTPLVVLGDVVIPDGITLVITTTVYFKENAGLIVQPGGKVFVIGGLLTSDCEQELWSGITVAGTGSPQQQQYQGYLEITESIVEHALCAVGTNCGAKTTGGIIKATNVRFYNNLCSVLYDYYPNANNVGLFKYCNFNIDEHNYFEPRGLNFENHVYLNPVRGLVFLGCNFMYANPNQSYVGIGINAMGSGFYVVECQPDALSPYPCGCKNPAPCYFTGLETGISAYTEGNPFSVVIDKSKFHNNLKGVNIEGIHNFEVTRNEIFDFIEYGIYSKSASGFRIEENELKMVNHTGLRTQYGIVICDSGDAANRVYNNTVHNVNWRGAIRAMGNNVGLKGIGLQFICNTFDFNLYDIVATQGDLIRPNQGNIIVGADNKFGNLNTILSLDLNNGQNITYYHSPGLQHYPKGIIHPNVHINPNAGKNNCLSTFCNDNIRGNNSEVPMQQKINDYLELQKEYNNLLVELESSNYLYILENIESGEFPEQKIMEAHLFIAKIDQISETMRDLSDNAIRKVMQGEILDFEMLKMWFETVNTPVAKYSLAETYFVTENYELADAIINEIPALFQFSEIEFADYNNYLLFHNLKKQLKFEERDWKELNDVEISLLKRVAEAKTGRASTMAKGILCFYYNICYKDNFDEEYIEPVKPKSIISKNEDFVFSDNKITTNVEDFEKLAIYDMTGRLIMINNHRQQLDITVLPAGTYIVKVYYKGANVSNYKFVKQ